MSEKSNVISIEQLMEISKNTVLTSENLNRQMGIFRKAVSNLETRQDETDRKIVKIIDDIQRIEDESRITRSQAKNINAAARIRVFKVLGIEVDEKGKVIPKCMSDYVLYFGGFISLLYRDCKKNGRMANAVGDTAKRDYVPVLEEVQNWFPTDGIEARKNYLDKLRKERKAGSR